MSLWSLPLESLTFEQLDDFLAAKSPESDRLDYKLDVPKELGKIIAAFSNTYGGLVVLGVDEDTKTTEPIWPPDTSSGKGMPNKRGLREQIMQIARDKIYPPVSIRMSPVIHNKHLPGKDCVLLAVRVDESRDAPHAIDRREVYVYERHGSTSPPFRLAEVDRISYLLDRRRRNEADREKMLQKEIDRASSFMPNQPLRWAAVVPFYPWRKLYPNSLCYQLHQYLLNSSLATRRIVQQMPEGSYLRGLLENTQGGGAYTSVSHLNSKGLVFQAEGTFERNTFQQTQPWIDLGYTARLLKAVIAAALKLYQHKQAEEPGYLMVSTGITRARNMNLHFGPGRSRNAFLDDAYRSDSFVDLQSLLATPYRTVAQLMDEVMFAFDMPAIANPQEFFEKKWSEM